jgi:hypothetical protein
MTARTTATRKINVTKDYRLFSRSDKNRPTNLRKRKKLERSMKTYGFLSCFPIVCYRNEHGKLIVKDGQHRLGLAEVLGLPVYWVDETIDFDVALVNSSSEKWNLRDYALTFAFCDQHDLPVGTGFSLLSGVTNFTNIQPAFIDGTFKIRDRTWADSVASIYGPLTRMAPEIRNARFIEACMAACRVESFDGQRLLTNAARCRDKLAAYSTREAYLDMLEQIYNHGRSRLMGLKAEATMAMRERNACKSKVAA